MRINAPAYSSPLRDSGPSGGEGVQVRGWSDRDTAAAGFLGGVQRSVSRAQQGRKVRLVARIFGDSAAEADAVTGLAADRLELIQQRLEPLHGSGHGCPVHAQDELLATPARGNVVRTQCAYQQLPHATKRVVTGFVTVLVVD